MGASRDASQRVMGAAEGNRCRWRVGTKAAARDGGGSSLLLSNLAVPGVLSDNVGRAVRVRPVRRSRKLFSTTTQRAPQNTTTRLRHLASVLPLETAPRVRRRKSRLASLNGDRCTVEAGGGDARRFCLERRRVMKDGGLRLGEREAATARSCASRLCRQLLAPRQWRDTGSARPPELPAPR